MIAEFSIIPIGKGESLGEYIAECVNLVKESGVKYQLTATSTILEGDYHAVMDVIEACHKKVLTMTNRVITDIRIDDRLGATNEMIKKVESVEKKVEGPLVRCP
jgi:uncharacterized protein (TIGR00106 family)